MPKTRQPGSKVKPVAITTQDFADMIGVSRKTLRLQVVEHPEWLPPFIQLPGGTVRFMLDDVRAWIETQKKAGKKAGKEIQAMPMSHKIHVKMNGDAKFRSLSGVRPSGQSLWVYLLTGPHNNFIPGLFFASPRTLAAKLGWTQEAFDACFAEIVGQGMALCDPEAGLIWLPQVISPQPTSKAAVASWGAELATLPECDLLMRAVCGPGGLMERLGRINPSFPDILLKGYAKHAHKALPVLPEMFAGRAGHA